MKYFNSILIVCLMWTLMACPLLDSPPPLSPLPIAKNSNIAFKAATQQCRLINDGQFSYSYDAAGNLISGQGGNFIYNSAGLITQATWFGIVTTFTYDANNLIASAKSSNGTLTNLFKYTNGVFTAHEQTDNSTGTTTTVATANGLGQAINHSTAVFGYDGRGNFTNTTDGVSNRQVYEYDDKINPVYQAFRFMKGQGSAFNPPIARIMTGGSAGFTQGLTPNNIVKLTTTYIGNTNLPPDIITLTYTYNAQGLPLTRKRSDGRPDITYQYENCQ